MRRPLRPFSSATFGVGSACLVAVVLSLALLVSGCNSYRYAIPEQTDDGWRTASLDDVGMDERVLRAMMGRITRNTSNHNIHSILIVKDGTLVFEEYLPGHRYDYSAPRFEGEVVEYDRDTPHLLQSVTKAITSLLVGIAIDRGAIGGIHEGIFTYLPQYSYLHDATQSEVTIEHLLTMTSGRQWNEMDVDLAEGENDIFKIWFVDDPIEYILEKPLAAEPGTRWYYNGGDANLLGEIVRSASGINLVAFGNEYLFEPLGISEGHWKRINASEIIDASGGISLRPRDMARIGQLYLNDGVWNGQRIVSANWIKQSTKEHARVSDPQWADREGEGYGYHWFLRTEHLEKGEVESFMRSGWGGQRISVFPALDMVVVFTGGDYTTPSPVNEMITDFILPAVQTGSQG